MKMFSFQVKKSSIPDSKRYKESFVNFDSIVMDESVDKKPIFVYKTENMSPRA